MAYPFPLSYHGRAVDICILIGPAIAFVVSLAKRVGFIRNNPKIVAALLAGAYASWHNIHPGAGAGVDVATLMQCFATQFAGAVATYEVAIQPVRKAAEGSLTNG